MQLTKEKKNKVVEYWHKSSSKDFEAAKEIIKKTKRYTTALFFMHLSLEKALKALYVEKFETNAPFTHNLVNLASKCELEISTAIEKDLLEINEFNLESRYPDEKFSLEKRATKVFTKKKLDRTAEILKWIFSK